MKKIDWSLLRKSVSGTTSASEKHDVDEWLGASPANRDYYGRMERFHKNGARPEVDLKANYKLFMQHTGLTLRRRIFTAYGSIAAASVAILLVFTFMNQHDLFTTGPAAYGAAFNEVVKKTTGDTYIQNLCSHGEMGFIDDNGFSRSAMGGQMQNADTGSAGGRILVLGDGTEVYVNPMEYPLGMPSDRAGCH